MSKQPSDTTADGSADLVALNQLRLEEDLTYDELGAQIGINGGALYRILNRQAEPIDRTLFKIRRFLETRETAKRTPKRRAS